ncbi:unnamed protein product, partial [Symbiodinium microadriaticum]
MAYVFIDPACLSEKMRALSVSDARVWSLLQRAPPQARKQLLQRFSEAQRLALERWVLTKKPLLPGCPQERARRGPAAVVAAGAGAPYVCSHRSHGGPVRYDARVSCWPFLLFTKMTLHLPTALSQLEVLAAVQRRWQRDMCQQDFASREVRQISFKRFSDAVALEFEAREMDLTVDSAFRFQAFVPANFLLGRRLGTPHFLVSEEGLQKGYEAWQSLYGSIHSAYAPEHGNFCGRRNRFTSIANTYSAEGLQEVWQKLRATYSAVFKKAGQSGKRVEEMVQMLSNPAVAAVLQGKAAPVAAAAAARKKVELRVREVGDAGGSFRRVVLSEGAPDAGTTFSQVESRVSEKFASKRDATGREVQRLGSVKQTGCTAKRSPLLQTFEAFAQGYSDPPPGLAVMTPPISVRDLEAEFSGPKTRAGYCNGRGDEDSLTSEKLYAFCSEEVKEFITLLSDSEASTPRAVDLPDFAEERHESHLDLQREWEEAYEE